MKIDKKEYWVLVFPVLVGFGLPVLVVSFFGLHRNTHQENAFFSLFITFGALMYVFYKTVYRKKFPEKFEEITSSFRTIATALFISSLSASIVATAISLVPAPAWFHIGLYVGSPVLVIYLLYKIGFRF
ncbi:MAG: hypothetical protein ABIL58_25745 [Pseudomonadota bacterium]